jgi:hypothetical protein
MTRYQFNFISVASYFCDVAFDVIVIYTLYQSETAWWKSYKTFFLRQRQTV